MQEKKESKVKEQKIFLYSKIWEVMEKTLKCIEGSK